LVATELLHATLEIPKGRGCPHEGIARQAALLQEGLPLSRARGHRRRGNGDGVTRPKTSKLGRRVALKILPEELANDPGSLQRLEREAQTASA